MDLKSFTELVNITDEWDYVSAISKSIRKNSGKTFFYLNSHTFYLLNHDYKFRNSLTRADYFIADGISIVIAARLLLGQKIEKVVFTHSFLNELGFFISENSNRLFLLGSDTATLEIAKEKILRDFPGAVIAGKHNGFLGHPKDSEEAIRSINETAHDILIVGMGMPVSEIWITENRSILNSPCIISVGGFIDQIAGRQMIAPRWTHNSGLEWLFRMLHEPRRLFKRYHRAHTYFLNHLFKELFLKNDR